MVYMFCNISLLYMTDIFIFTIYLHTLFALHLPQSKNVHNPIETKPNNILTLAF